VNEVFTEEQKTLKFSPYTRGSTDDMRQLRGRRSLIFGRMAENRPTSDSQRQLHVWMSFFPAGSAGHAAWSVDNKHRAASRR